MTDLVVAVRLKADGSGLVGQVRPATAAVQELTAATTAASTAAGDMSSSTADVAAQTRAYQRDLAQLRTQIDPVGEAHRRMAQAVDLANTALSRGDITVEQHARALKDAEAAARGHAAALGGSQIATMELEHVVRAASDAYSAGIPISRIFGSELGRVTEAATLMGGELGGIGKFLSGGWGLALSLAVGVLGPFIGSLFDGEDKSKKLTAQSLLLEDALRKQKVGTDEARKALDDYNAAQDRTRQSDSLAIDLALRRAAADLAGAQATREKTRATLADALAQEERTKQAALDEQRYGKNDTNTFAYQGAIARSAALQEQLAGQDADIARLQQTQRNLLVQDASRAAAEAVDPLKKLNDQYDRMRDGAIRAARGNDQLAASLKATLTGTEQQRKAAVAAERQRESDARKAERPVRPAEPLTTFLTPVQGGRITGQFGEDRPGHQHAGVDYAVPVGTPVRAPAAGTIDVAGERQGYGNAIYINFGGGTTGRFGHLAKFNVKPGDTVEAGDIIGYTGGAAGAAGAGDSTGPHLHYEVRQNGRAVNPLTGRFRTDAGAAGDDADKQEAQRQKASEEAAKRVAEANKRAADELDRMNVTWGEQPTLIKRAADDQAKLQVIIDAYAGKQDAVSQAIVAQARAEQQAIEVGKVRPLTEYLRGQSEELRVGALILGGHQDEAEALRVQIGLERQMGPLTADQKDQVLATVQALDAQSRQLDVLRQKQGLYLDALGDMKGIVEDATQAFVRGDLGQLIKAPGKLLAGFTQLQGKLLFDKLFGDAFRGLEDQLQGRNPVDAASARLADGVDQVAGQTKRTVSSFGSVGDAADKVAAAFGHLLTGASTAGVAAPSPDSGVGAALASTGTLAGIRLDAAGHAINDLTQADAHGAIALPTQPISSQAIGDALGKHDQTASQLYASGLSKVGEQLGHVLGVSDPKKFGESIGKGASTALAGAATGQLISGLGNALGVHLNSTGSQLGGALGGLSGIPGGSIIGSVLGGIVGILFAPKAKPGGVTIGNAGGEAGQTGTSGSDAKLIAASSELGSAVSDGINQIAQQLGGTLGNFSVSIGKYKDDLRVNENGRPLGGVTGSGAVGFGDDQQAAVSYAISRAIAQGAVQGLSSAVTKALQSSTDVNKALQEALNVADLEKVIGGIGAQLDGIFKDEAAKAADRVALAKKYGLDLLKVEQANAQERTDLVASTLQSRIGSLQDLLTSLTSGDLFEGDAATRRKALQDQITAAKADAEAGKDGADDKLAQLEQQLVTTSKEAFGTAGPQYAADRASATADVQHVIDLETARVNAAAQAQQATTDAVNQVATLTNESNDILAQINAKLGQLAAGSGSGAGSLAPDLSLTARLALA